jgi:ornithine decarboxylase
LGRHKGSTHEERRKDRSTGGEKRRGRGGSNLSGACRFIRRMSALMSPGLVPAPDDRNGPAASPRNLADDPRIPRALVKEHGSPLLVLDCDTVRAQYRALATALPGVDLHYAMKALSHPAVIATLDEEGSFFDISTTGEIELLRQLRISPARMIHTHPIKRDQDIRDALEYGCSTFVVDNVDEMIKFGPYRERVSLLLRVGFRSPDAVVDLAKKFGCAPDDAFALLELAGLMGLPLDGLSFHVGSQCGSSHAHVAAIEGCRELIAKAQRAGLTPIRVLDIGGGFPASYRASAPSIETFAAPIRTALAEVSRDVRIIAEPGRFLAANAIEGIATVVGKARRQGSFWYYLDDGVYGSHSGKIYDGAIYPLSAISDAAGEPQPSVLAGPTCDSVDIVADGISLPELQIGDLIVARSMGAYTTVSASEFNSIPKAKILVRNGPARDGLRDDDRPTAAGPGPAGPRLLSR